MITCLEQISFALFLSMLSPEIVDIQSSTKVVINATNGPVVWVFDTVDSFCVVQSK